MSALPAIAGVQTAAPAHTRLTLDIPADLPVLDGHFSRHPVVPGVAQIDWAVHFARQHAGCSGQFNGMRDIKFTQAMIPPLRIHLHLDWNAQTGCLGFRYVRCADQRSCSSGSLCFTT